MTISTYIDDVLGSWKTTVSWSAGMTTFVTSKVLEKYGATVEADCTDTIKLHAICDVEIWGKVLQEVSRMYQFSADGGSFSRNQMFEQVKYLYDTAVTDAMQYLPAYNVRVGTVDFTQNPYGLDSFTRSLLGY